MKTTRTRTLITGLFIASFIIIACQKGGLLKEDSTESVSAKASTSSTIQSTNPLSTLPDCNTQCINENGPYIESSDSKTQYWGNPSNPHSKTVSYVAYNTATSFVIKVTFVHSGGNASNTVSATAFGSTQTVATLASGTTATFTFALPSGWSKCDNVSFSVYQEGQNSPVNMSGSYNLYGICVVDKGCETSFTGEAIACGNQREAVYTFISKDALSYIKMQGGLTNFTGEDAEVIISGGNLTSSQWTPGGSSNRVIKIEGSVDACETITIRIRWNSTNSGGIITGSWSVKDANGVDIAPAVDGLTCSN